MKKKPILSVKDLHVNFHLPNLTVNAVKGVTFTLSEGETLALVGESGSGKSVTSLSILRLLPRWNTQYPCGEILFKGTDVLKMTEKDIQSLRGADISMIFQEPMTALNPLQKIHTQIAEILRTHNKKMAKKQVTNRVIELLERVKLPQPEQRMHAYPHQLSGGQRQRVVIAMALANTPKILVADEPTTALDVTVQEDILKLLKDLQKTFNMAVIFVTHDLTIVHKIADSICIMQKGQIIERGTVQDVVKNPKCSYTKELLQGVVKGSKKPYDKNSPTLLSVKNMNVEFPLGRSLFGKPTSTLKAVKNISLSLKKGQTMGIVGESGSGKSTLAMAILNLLERKNVLVDTLEFQGSDITQYSFQQMCKIRKDMQIVFQDPFGSLSPRMTVREILGEGLNVHFPGLSTAQRQQKIQEAVKDVELHLHMINRYPHEFSGGQRQRIAIARALILRPKFLVLDEPTSALDRLIQVQIVDLLRALQQKYALTYLCISHDLAVVRAMSDYVLVMQNGCIVECGTVEEIFTHAKKHYTKNLIRAAFDITKIQ